jgi:hypothetical protein
MTDQDPSTVKLDIERFQEYPQQGSLLGMRPVTAPDGKDGCNCIAEV